MTMQKLIFIICTCIAIIVCNDQASKTDRKNAYSETPATREDSLNKDIEDAHNVAMAKTGRLRKSIEDVKIKLDSLNKVSASKRDKNYQQALVNLQEDLDYADNSMNLWMDGYKPDSVFTNKELRIQYFQSEKDKVMKIKDNILHGLHRADSLLRK